jgi:hypothetical protein
MMISQQASSSEMDIVDEDEDMHASAADVKHASIVTARVVSTGEVVTLEQAIAYADDEKVDPRTYECPDCNRPIKLRNGNKRSFFAHIGTMEGSVESHRHDAAKQAIKTRLHECTFVEVCCACRRKSGASLHFPAEDGFTAYAECTMHLPYRVDVMVMREREDGKRLAHTAIEVFATHEVGVSKRMTLFNRGVDVCEVDADAVLTAMTSPAVRIDYWTGRPCVSCVVDAVHKKRARSNDEDADQLEPWMASYQREVHRPKTAVRDVVVRTNDAAALAKKVGSGGVGDKHNSLVTDPARKDELERVLVRLGILVDQPNAYLGRVLSKPPGILKNPNKNKKKPSGDEKHDDSVEDEKKDTVAAPAANTAGTTLVEMDSVFKRICAAIRLHVAAVNPLAPTAKVDHILAGVDWVTKEPIAEKFDILLLQLDLMCVRFRSWLADNAVTWISNPSCTDLLSNINRLCADSVALRYKELGRAWTDKIVAPAFTDNDVTSLLAAADPNIIMKLAKLVKRLDVREVPACAADAVVVFVGARDKTNPEWGKVCFALWEWTKSLTSPSHGTGGFGIAFRAKQGVVVQDALYRVYAMAHTTQRLKRVVVHFMHELMFVGKLKVDPDFDVIDTTIDAIRDYCVERWASLDAGVDKCDGGHSCGLEIVAVDRSKIPFNRPGYVAEGQWPIPLCKATAAVDIEQPLVFTASTLREVLTKGLILSAVDVVSYAIRRANGGPAPADVVLFADRFRENKRRKKSMADVVTEVDAPHGEVKED